MREIKFRAYIKKYNKVFDVLDIFRKFPDEDFQRVFIDKPIEDGEPSNYRIDGVDNILMQYTSIKDNDGNEIYEGDILNTKWNDWNNSFGCEEFNIVKCPYLSQEYFHWYSELEDMYCKIIGNVYENPELLKL